MKCFMLIAAMVGLMLGAGELPGEAEMVFRYVPSAEPALAEMGGAVRGTFKQGNIRMTDEEGKKVIRFENPGTGTLSFPLAGNLTPAEGTMLMDIAYDFDPAEVHAAVVKAEKWSQQYFLFRADKEGKGVAMFLDIVGKGKPGSIAVSVMAAPEQHKWGYAAAFLEAGALPRGRKCTVGFTWKENMFAMIVNGKVYPPVEMKGGEPAWGPVLSFGGGGASAFPGKMYEVRIYQKSAI